MSAPCRRLRRSGGFTLIELVIAIVIISVSVTGVLLAYTVTVRSSADPMVSYQATAIAEAYLEEILAKPFSDPDGIAESDRADYDDVGDYNGLSDAGVRDALGSSITELAAYQVDVAVGVSADLGIGSPDELRVDVRVTHPSGIDITLSGYRTSHF
jgi:MSHA pilin protein MshD